jgi:lysosomal acid lipase/cholesteryl ester hydrolase
MLPHSAFLWCAVCVVLASLAAAAAAFQSIKILPHLAAAACVDPDCFATVPRLISEKGFPAESHDVVTADGYILTMHRIPRPGSPVVLLQHGLLDASETWVINDADNRCIVVRNM